MRIHLLFCSTALKPITCRDPKPKQCIKCGEVIIKAVLEFLAYFSVAYNKCSCSFAYVMDFRAHQHLIPYPISKCLKSSSFAASFTKSDATAMPKTAAIERRPILAMNMP